MCRDTAFFRSKNMMLRKHNALFFLFVMFGWKVAFAQSFVKVSSASNALSQQGPLSGIYAGVSWIDYNGDGLIDCFVNSNNLYRNDGNGAFTRIDIGSVNFGLGNSNTWGDYDNDGDPDLFISASPCRFLRNDGSDVFTLIDLTNPAPIDFNAWAATWGDYDNDGWLDLFVTHPAGFVGTAHTNWLFRSMGNGVLANVPTGDPVTGLAAYTVGSWTDYDLDGDLDLFIGSGEISALSKDHIYINQRVETGTPTLVRNQEGVLYGDLRDGQNWNWIDYDNDGDLDGFVTNYFSSKVNDFYRNDNGQYTHLNAATAGTIANQTGMGLTNLWADFDNDGYLDALVVFDGNQKTRFYHNNGNGTFTEQNKVFCVNHQGRGAAAGDYDNDGFQDLFIASGSANGVGLFHNDGNENAWVMLALEGVVSNRSAIGARVRAKATINGTAMWQYREISTQNSFAGHNDLRVHFGLGDATAVDSVIIDWPSGLREVLTQLQVRQICHVTEGQGSDCALSTAVVTPHEKNTQLIVAPNCTKGQDVTIAYRFASTDTVRLKVYDLNGLQVYNASQFAAVGTFIMPVHGLVSGLYLVVAENGSEKITQKLIIQH